jgi:hypothetical protein
LTFNPAIVQGENVTIGPLLGNTGRTVVPVGPTIDNAAGRVIFGAFTFGSQPGVSGAGDLACVRFRVRAAGQTSLAFSETLIGDPQGAPLLVGDQNGANVIAGAATYLPLLLNR